MDESRSGRPSPRPSGCAAALSSQPDKRPIHVEGTRRTQPGHPRRRRSRRTARASQTACGNPGLAILQISSYWQQAGGRGVVEIDLLPGHNAREWLAGHRLEAAWIGDLLAGMLPKRVALAFAAAHGWDQPLVRLSNRVVDEIADTLGHWRIQPSGTLGFDKAEVTLGGVDTDCLSQQTMEAKSVPGLYFVGEVVDVTGWLGGYNFQWAWSSAVAAGRAV
ncbi:MAG: NAD(P)/FAD-dependent oxidoreductase [Candidatus Methylophosphatis roskildensis]